MVIHITIEGRKYQEIVQFLLEETNVKRLSKIQLTHNLRRVYDESNVDLLVYQNKNSHNYIT